MKKFLLSSLVLVIFIVYALHTNLADEQASGITANTPGISVLPPGTATPVQSVGPSPIPPTTSPTRVPTLLATPVPTATPAGRYKNGTYTGSVADAFYGNIQVQAVISGGQITDVNFSNIQGQTHFKLINSQAMPFLKQEAIQPSPHR